MIPIPAQVPIGADWILTCPRVNGFVPGGVQPVQEIIWRTVNQISVVEWSYAIITPLNINQGTETNQNIRNWVQNTVGYPGDDAGHIVGQQLGGLGTVQWNIFPQNANFNRGAYAQSIEAIWRNVGNRGLTANVWYNFLDFNDPARPLRPGRFQFLAIISDGTTLSNDLLNPR